MGGQVADHGSITGKGLSFQVADVQKNKGGKYMHSGKMVEGVLKVGDPVEAAIDVDRRKAVMRAHTATHLLDTALHMSSRPAPWWSLTVSVSTSPTSPP
jgi:alanyl-tRNA synthetase